jgi:hypothetical protein
LGGAELSHGEVVTLSRGRDRSTYADPATIPTPGERAKRQAVIGPRLSG